MTVEKGVLKNFVRVSPLNIDVPFEDDAVLRQCPRFVRTQHVHRAKVLYRIEALDDDLLARHGNRALGKIYRHDHRQHFRREADRDSDREQQGLKPIVLRQSVDQEDGGHHDNDEPDHQPGKFIDAEIEGRWNAPARDLMCELAEKRARSGPQDHAGAVTGHDVCAHEA